MADTKISELTDGGAVQTTDNIPVARGSGNARVRVGSAAALNAPASGDAASGEVVKGSDTRLTDSREWTASTVLQAEAEAGIATTRRAWTAERVFQAIAAWWSGSAAKTKLDGIEAGATANATNAQLRDRSTHTGTQSAGTITGLATVATTGAYADLSGKPTLGTAAPLDVAASGDASSAQVVKGNDSRLTDARTPTTHAHAISDVTGLQTALDGKLSSADASVTNAREWTAATVTQAEAEAGTDTTRKAFTVLRVWQAIAAWWTSISTAAGRALVTAADAAAQRSALGLGTAATTASTAYAASGAVTSSGLTMETARLLGRSTTGTGAPEEISVGSGLSLSAGTLSATGGGGSGTKTLDVHTPMTSQPPAASFATLDTRNSIAVLDFDAAADESATWVSVIPEAAVLTSGLSVRIVWTATSATSGNCRWRVAFEDMIGSDIDSDSFDTAAEATGAANGTSGIPTVTEITITTIDSLAAGDAYRLRVTRVGTDATNDTMTGDAELIAVEVRGVA